MPAAPPRLGLTTYRERATWAVWDEFADLLPVTYANEVAAVGAVPMLLPPAAPDGGAAEAALEGLHGLVLTGGPDVDPERYGVARGLHTGPPRPERDQWELHLVRGALAAGMPVLAICRGMQVLNVALGGTLVQHLPESVGHEGHRPIEGRHARHDVEAARNSLVESLLGSPVEVATYHHQALDVVADGLVATAWTPDGVVEAVEWTGPEWVVGVQWHPEVHDGARLFAALRDAAQSYRSRRAPVGS